MENWTLYLDPNSRDICLDQWGDLLVLQCDETTAQNVRNTLLVWQGEFLLDQKHGTDYEQIMGKKPGEMPPGVGEETIRSAIFQEAEVAEITQLSLASQGRQLQVQFEGRLVGGDALGLEVEV